MLGRRHGFQVGLFRFSSSRYRPSAFTGTWDRMIYASTGAARYKADMQTKSISSILAPEKAGGAGIRPRDTFSTQTPLMIIGLAAISMILLINSHARPTAPRENAVAYACAECGTVVAVRRTALAALPPSYQIDVQMLDGSIRTVQLAAGFNVGDIVRVQGNALTLRTAS